MSDTQIFEVESDVDLKTYVKLRNKACLGDSVVYKFKVFSENAPVDLSKYKYEMRCRLPKSGVVYSETDNITVNGNELTVTCDNVLTAEVGEAIITLRLVDITTYQQKSNYIIILKVMSTIDADEEIQTSSVLSSLSSLDYAINRYLELKVDLMAEVTLAEKALSDLINEVSIGNTTIINAQTINTTLLNTYNNANLLNNDLKNNINSATNLNAQVQTNISDLNSSIAVAKYYNNELKATTTNAQVLDEDLKQENQLAGQQIITLQGFGDINVLIKMMGNYKIELDSMYNFINAMMQDNPIAWTYDDGSNVTYDDGTNVTI